eukprot:4239342-Pyramimonas_sp.AAC.1
MRTRRNSQVSRVSKGMGQRYKRDIRGEKYKRTKYREGSENWKLCSQNTAHHREGLDMGTV